jgi:hypothetical protein
MDSRHRRFNLYQNNLFLTRWVSPMPPCWILHSTGKPKSVNQSVSQSVSRTHLCMLPMAMIMKIVFFCRDVIPSSAQKIMTCFSTASLNSYEITRCQIQNNNNLLQFYFPFPLYPAHQTTTIHFYVLLTFTAFSFVLGSKFFCAKMIDY